MNRRTVDSDRPDGTLVTLVRSQTLAVMRVPAYVETHDKGADTGSRLAFLLCYFPPCRMGRSQDGVEAYQALMT
jgi:hypothetical protein